MEDPAVATGIEGVFYQPLKVIHTPGGPVMHMLRAGSPLLPTFSQGFGEIYFSETFPGAIKAWKRHKRQTQLFAVPVGLLQIVLYDGRLDSSTCGTLIERRLGRPDDYGLLRIPPMIWYGFTALCDVAALICNCADLPHDPSESERLAPDDPTIPYTWSF